MRTPIDAQLKAELAKFRLRYQCEHCAYFEPETGHCALGFPNAEHRAQSLSTQPPAHQAQLAEGAPPLSQGGRLAGAQEATLVFCKEFELA